MPQLREPPPIANSALSVILIVDNQETDLVGVVEGWITYLNGRKQGHEIVLVDDGSTASARSQLETLKAKHKSVRVVRHETRLGFGAALRTGLSSCRHPLVFYTVGANRYRPSDLNVLFKWIDRVDLVAGCRSDYLAARRSTWKEFMGRLLLRLMFSVRVTDPGCLYVLARRAIFLRIPIQSKGAFAHAEVLAKANFLSCLMTEVPISYQAVVQGKQDKADDTGVDFKQTMREARRVFAHPDFGPAVVVEE